MAKNKHKCKMCGINMSKTEIPNLGYCSDCEDSLEIIKYLKDYSIDIDEDSLYNNINAIIDEADLDSLYSKLDKVEHYFEMEYSIEKIEVIKERLSILKTILKIKEDD